MANQSFDASLGSVILWLHSVFESEIGIWRVYVEGDRGQKPLYSGTNAVEAQRVYSEAEAGMKKNLEVRTKEAARLEAIRLAQEGA